MNADPVAGAAIVVQLLADALARAKTFEDVSESPAVAAIVDDMLAMLDRDSSDLMEDPALLFQRFAALQSRQMSAARNDEDQGRAIARYAFAVFDSAASPWPSATKMHQDVVGLVEKSKRTVERWHADWRNGNF